MKTKNDSDFDAQYYTDNSKIQHTLADKLLNGHKFRENATILDIGCGDGSITANLSKYLPKGNVVGIDASPNMIDFAKAHFPQSKFPNLEFILKRAENLSFTEKFDAILSFNCFQWIRTWKETLKLLSNFLKVDGEMLLLTYSKENIYYLPFQKASEHFPEYVDKAAHKTLFSEKELQQGFIEAGFKLTSFESYNDTVFYENAKALKDFVRAWLKSFIPLPENLHENFLDLLIQECVPYQINKEEPGIRLPYTALLIKASKA